jgi:hypothetical protein
MMKTVYKASMQQMAWQNSAQPPAGWWFLVWLNFDLKKEVMCFSETLFHIRTTWCCIPEDGKTVYKFKMMNAC